MKIDPAIVDHHWELAAVDQLSNELEAQGFDVRREQQFGNPRADLVATAPDGSITIYEIKVPARGRTPGWARQVAALREVARDKGGRFKLVLVRPPHAVAVEIEGLEEALRDALIKAPPPELRGLAAHPIIRAVEGVDLNEITMHFDPRTIEVAGEGLLIVEVDDSPMGVLNELDLPFQFKAALDEANRVLSLEGVRVDVAQWQTDDGGAPDSADEASGRILTQ